MKDKQNCENQKQEKNFEKTQSQKKIQLNLICGGNLFDRYCVG